VADPEDVQIEVRKMGGGQQDAQLAREEREKRQCKRRRRKVMVGVASLTSMNDVKIQ
jgi:hypothetical protein